MNKLLVLTTLLAFPVIAEDQAPVEFLEVGITKWDYKKPKKEGFGGMLEFTSATMSRANLTFNLTNKSKIFDAQTLYKKDYIGFKTDQMLLDFKLDPGSGFEDIQSLYAEKNDAVINPSFFSFNGNKFAIDFGDKKISMDRFFVFCTAGNPDIDMASVEGIEVGCMSELSVNPTSSKAPLNLTFERKYDDGDKMIMNAELGYISLIGKSVVELNANKMDMKVGNYFLETEKVKLNCLKDDTLLKFDTDKLMKDCENTADIKVPRALLRNKVDETKFYILPEVLTVSNEKLFFTSPVIQFVDKESSVTAYDLALKCAKADEAETYDLHSIIGECLKSGNISINRLVSRDETKLYWDYEKIMSQGLNPIADISEKEKTAKRIRISIDNGNALITASAYKKILGKYTRFDVYLKGTTEHYPEKDQIVLNVDKIHVPIGWFKIKWKKFLLNIMKKALVGENIQFIDDKIVLQL